MDLERHLPSAVDDPEPTWADEDAAQRVKAMWLARAREMAAKVEARLAAERSGDQTAGAAATPPEPAPAVAQAEWFSSANGSQSGLDVPPALVRHEDREETVVPAPLSEARIEEPVADTAWFTAPEVAPGTIDALSEPGHASSAPPHVEFPPAWFPAPDAAAGGTRSAGAVEALAVEPTPLERFESGLPLVAADPAPAVPTLSFAPREEHLHFASTRLFLETLQAEREASASEPVSEAAPVDDRAHVDPSPALEAPTEVAPPIHAYGLDRTFDVPPVLLDAEVQAPEPSAFQSMEMPLAVVEPELHDAYAGVDGRQAVEYDVRTDACDACEPYLEPRADVDAQAHDPAVHDAVAFESAGHATASHDTSRAWPPAPPAVEPAGDVAHESDAIGADPEAVEEAAAPPPLPVLAPARAVPPAPARRPRWPLTRVAAMAVAAVGATAVVVTMLVPKSNVDAPAPAVHAGVLPKPAAAKSAPVRSARTVAVPRPAWHETAEWTAGRRKSVAYEVAAERPVRLWMRQVTPVLVVRCLGGTLDAFVVTQSASALEAGRSDHTVRLAFDDGPDTVERWTDSAEHDGLFAPDGRSLLARAAGATTLRFTFTPHNAPAAEASFSLAGADALKAPLTKYCK